MSSWPPLEAARYKICKVGYRSQLPTQPETSYMAIGGNNVRVRKREPLSGIRDVNSDGSR